MYLLHTSDTKHNYLTHVTSSFQLSLLSLASLVHKNVERNLETVKKVGLENFVIEVVTDNALDLKKQPHVREIVVPENFVTNNKTLYKGADIWVVN